MRRYAEDTKVPVDQSRTEIERTLTRYGATSFAYAQQPAGVTVMFEAKDRRIRFDLPMLPVKAGENERSRKTREQETRRRWRALGMCIKSKLEAVSSGIETFEEAFLSHVVMPDGRTVGQHTTPRIANAYNGGTMQPLLPGPSS